MAYSLKNILFNERITMKIFVYSLALFSLATAGHSETYTCQFNNAGTRGWLPETVVLDTEQGKVYSHDQVDDVAQYQTESVIWRQRVLAESNQYVTLVYRLNIRNEHRASLEVQFEGYSNNYRKSGTCEVE